MSTEGAELQPDELSLQNGDIELFARVWRPVTAPRAVVVICHGLNSHSGQYYWAAEQLLLRGFAVYAIDLRGRGRSSGERFYVERIEDYASDVDVLVERARTREGRLPLFLLGHSAGGVTSCLYALMHPAKLSGLVCESFAFQVPAPEIALTLLRGLSHLLPHAHVLRLHNEDFSRDPGIVAQMNADPLIAGERQPSRTVAALARADERLERAFPLIALPLLILHGTADKATRPSGSKLFFETAGSADKTLKLYEGHFHDLLNDIGREQVVRDIANWLEAHL